MDEATMATIIKNLAEQLYNVTQELKDTKEMLKMARGDSSDWYRRYTEALEKYAPKGECANGYTL